MQYGELISCDNSTFGDTCNELNLTYIGWRQNNRSDYCIDKYFSEDTVKLIQNKIIQLTKGIEPENRGFFVPADKICHLLTEIYKYQRPKTGDIYSRYIIPDGAPRNDVQEMINKVIEIIYNDIKTSYGIIKNNSKLSIWVTRYGEGNPWGLQQVPRGFAKINHKRPMSMMFNMNY